MTSIIRNGKIDFQFDKFINKYLNNKMDEESHEKLQKLISMATLRAYFL